MGKIKKRAKKLYKDYKARSIFAAFMPDWKYLRSDWKAHFKRQAKAGEK